MIYFNPQYPNLKEKALVTKKNYFYRFPVFNGCRYAILDSIQSITPIDTIIEKFKTVGSYLESSLPESSLVGIMKSRHLLRYPIEYKKYRQWGPNNYEQIDGYAFNYDFSDQQKINITKFHNFSIGEIVNTEIDCVTPEGSIQTPIQYFAVKECELYDGRGNLVQHRDFNNMPISNIYENSGNQPVARVINAEREKVFYSNFEDAKTLSGSSFSNDDWESGFCSIRETNSYTGKKCFLSHGTYSLKTKRILPAGKYRIRMWTKMETGTSGTIILAEVPGAPWNVTSNWQMHERVVTLSSSSILTFNPYGEAIMIDDISIIPIDAQIETFTWHPLYGMTSKTDNNGNTLFFSYDGLGRLTLVKDQDGNIRETHKYHIAQ